MLIYCRNKQGQNFRLEDSRTPSLSYCASRKLENVHSRNKQQTQSEIKSTQRSQCAKPNRRWSQRWTTCLCLGGPKKLTSSKSGHQSGHLFFKLTLQSDAKLCLPTVSMGVVSYHGRPGGRPRLLVTASPTRACIPRSSAGVNRRISSALTCFRVR